MSREMMEEIFWMVGEEHGTCIWYEIFDSDLFEIVCERIARKLGFTELGEYDLWSELLDWETEEFSGWYSEMVGDL